MNPAPLCVRDAVPEDIATLEGRIPEFTSRGSAAILSRLAVPGAIALVAHSNEGPVGFKAGYPLNEATFYSWVGGVLPQARRTGVAQALLAAQEARLRAAGYAAVQVKSDARFPAMLRLLARNGYVQIDTETPLGATHPKLIFRKALRAAEVMP